jgi:hypothetical protein
VDRLNPTSRRVARASGEKSLARMIEELQPNAIGILLRSIAPNVANAIALAGWHGELIHLPYPGRWVQHRKAFIDLVTPLIRCLNSRAPSRCDRQ